MASSATDADSVEWNDVTNVISSITSTMELGAMISSPNFSLHSAMSALEIGDGVLDAAMKGRLLYIQDIVNNDASLNQMLNVTQNDNALIGTLDELIKLLWSFFNGNSDQFSIYSCLYLYDEIQNHPKNTTNKTLYLFIDTIKMCCGYARELVILSGISEDDDWSKSRDFDLSNFDRIDEIQNALQSHVKEYNKGSKPPHDVKLSENSDLNHTQHEQEAKQEETFTKYQYAEALCYRFEFISSLLNIMRQMYDIAQMLKLDDNGNTNAKKEREKKPMQHTVSRAAQNAKKSKSSKKQNTAHAKHSKKRQNKGKNANKKQNKGKTQKGNRKQIQKEKEKGNDEEKANDMYLIDLNPSTPCTLSNECINIHKTSVSNFKCLSSGLLRIVNHLIETVDMGQRKPFGFDDRIGNTKSVHSPRKQRIPPKTQCFTSFRNWCKSLRFTCNICTVTTFDGFLEFLDAFNRMDMHNSSDEFPNVVIRSFLTIIIEQFVKYDTFLWSNKPLTHFIQLSFRDLCEWCRIFRNTHKQYLGDYHTFYSRVETAIRDVVRQKLLHITRQMDWTKRIIKNWQILETESPEIDKLTTLSYLAGFDEKYHVTINQMEEYKAQSAAFSSWIVDKCCGSMINYIFIHLSCHMRLYAAYEMEYVYYYLEYLFRTKIQIYKGSFRRFQKVDIEKLNEIINPNYAKMKARRKQKKHKKANAKKEETQLLPPIDVHDKYVYVVSEAQRCLCFGLFELMQSFYQINRDGLNKGRLKWNGLSDRDRDRMDVDEKENGNDNDNKPQRLGDESLRFCHRFNIFHNVDQPLPISYRQYRTIVFEYDKNYKSLSDKLKQSQIQFDQSSRYFGLLQNIKKFNDIPSYQDNYIRAARKVAVMNKIFASKLLKTVQHDNDSTITIKHHFDEHPFYAVFYIDEKVQK